EAQQCIHSPCFSKILWRKVTNSFSARSLPGSLLATPPQNQTECRRILIFLQNARRVGKKVRLIGEIAPPLIAHYKAVGQLVFESQRILLERLGHAAEHAAAIREVFGAATQRHLGRQLITRIDCAARYAGWGSRLAGPVIPPEALNHVIAFQRQRPLGSS